MNTGQLSLRTGRTTNLGCALMLALALLAGCGPGTGGTGTGQTSTPLESFGATPANICTSAPSTALNCPPQTPPGNTGAADTVTLPTTPNNGTSAVIFSTTTDGQDINLFMVGNIANLRDRCLGLLFEGEWGTVDMHDSRFYGTFTTGDKKEPQLASLTIEAKEIPGREFKGLMVVLRDAAGKEVVGPVLLRPTIILTSNPSACPM
jgi:hypothetical protein